MRTSCARSPRFSGTSDMQAGSLLAKVRPPEKPHAHNTAIFSLREVIDYLPLILAVVEEHVLPPAMRRGPT